MGTIGERQREMLEELRKDSIEVSPRVRVSKSFIGSGVDDGRVARSASIARGREAAERKRIEEEKRRRIEEARTEQERIKVAEREKLIQDISRRRGNGGRDELIVGLGSRTEGFEFRGGKSVPIEKPTIIKNIGESQASFEARARQFGKGVSQAEPEKAKEFVEFKTQEALRKPVVEVERPRTGGEIAEDISETGKKATAFDIFLGAVGEKFIGVDLPFFATRDKKLPFIPKLPSQKEITSRDVKEGLRATDSFVAKVTAEFIPTTPLGTAAFIATPFAIAKLAPIARTGVALTFGTLGTITAFDKDLTPVERTAGGVVGVLGFTGATFETLPFIRGIKVQTIGRLTRKFRPVKVEEGIKKIKAVKDVGDVGVVLAGAPLKTGASAEVDLPIQSPLKVGAFSKAFKDQRKFIEKPIEEQVLGTSQRNLFKQGVDIPLEKEFFVSPEDPFTNLPLIRESRLALIDFFKTPKGGEIQFGFPPKSQIGLVFKGRGFKSGTSSELELIKTSGTLKDITKIGETTFKLQAVDIFKLTTDQAKGVSKSVRGIDVTTETPSRVAGESLLSGLGSAFVTRRTTFGTGFTGIVRGLFKTKPPTTKTIIPATKVSAFPTRPTPRPTIPSPPTGTIGGGSIPPTIPTTPTIPPSVPTIPTTPPSVPTTPTMPPSIPITTKTPPPPPPFFAIRKRTKRISKGKGRSWKVLAKPRGKKKFKKINRVPLSRRDALSLGSYITDTSLSAQFKIKATPKQPQSPKLLFPPNYWNLPKIKDKFRDYKIIKGKKKKLDNHYIEKKSKRLDTKNEQAGIQLAKRLSQLRKPKTKQTKRRKK